MEAWLCTCCQRSDATRFCLCVEADTMLCDSCLQSHTAKNTAVIHMTLPIAAYSHHRAPGYIDRLQARITGNLEAKRKAEETVRQIVECEEALVSGIGSITEELTRYRDEMTKKLEELKSYVMGSYKLVEDSVYSDDPAFSNELARDIREHWHASVPDFAYFSYTLSVSAVLQAITSVLSVSLNSSHKSPIAVSPSLHICSVRGKEVKIVDLLSGRKHRFEVREAASQGTMFCSVSDDIIAGVGGCPATPSAFFLHVSTHEMTSVPPMATPRNIPGVIGIDGDLYVFGGYREKTPLSSCEKYSPDSQTWSNLPDMAYPRGLFTPCECQRQVYLVDMSQTHRKVEVFSLDSKKFAVLSAELPSGRQFSVATVVEDELIVFGTARKVGKLRLSGEKAFRVGEFADQGNKAASVFHPLVLNRKVFVVSYESGDLLEFDLDRMVLSVSSFQ